MLDKKEKKNAAIVSVMINLRNNLIISSFQFYGVVKLTNKKKT